MRELKPCGVMGRSLWNHCADGVSPFAQRNLLRGLERRSVITTFYPNTSVRQRLHGQQVRAI
jgi:hypothetical protein